MDDRNYYRMLDDTGLLRAAADNPTAELAVVLGERMEAVVVDYDAKVEELRETVSDRDLDINQLDDKIYMLQSEIAKNGGTIAAMAAEIEQLKETSK